MYSKLEERVLEEDPNSNTRKKKKLFPPPQPGAKREKSNHRTTSDTNPVWQIYRNHIAKKKTQNEEEIIRIAK